MKRMIQFGNVMFDANAIEWVRCGETDDVGTPSAVTLQFAGGTQVIDGKDGDVAEFWKRLQSVLTPEAKWQTKKS